MTYHWASQISQGKITELTTKKLAGHEAERGTEVLQSSWSEGLLNEFKSETREENIET